MSNSLDDQKRFRTFNVLDYYNRERLGIQVDFSLPNGPVICTLKQVIKWRGRSLALRCDNGPNYISQNLMTEPLPSKSPCCTFNQINQQKTPPSSDLIEPSGTSGWAYTASAASNISNCARHNGFKHTIMNRRIPQLPASHKDVYRRWHNSLLLISVINGWGLQCRVILGLSLVMNDQNQGLS